MIPDTLLNCDLCILAYQTYHQSVIWPLDPWYEVLARGATERRAYFMRRVHAFARTLPSRTDTTLYAGPGCVGGLGGQNTELDPILTSFGQIRPRDPALTGDGAVFIALKAPSYVTDPIRRVSACTYAGPFRHAFPHGAVGITEIIDYGTGHDELIAFEGGTGSFEGSDAAFSPMGYVLKRTRADRSWDAHIVFRGSRSGNAVRALLSARDGTFCGPSGNADWVTDMASKQKVDDYVGGAVAVGFAAALRHCMGTLQYALRRLHQKYGAPQSIQVAGHSLGAALASLCCGALTSGIPGTELRKLLPGWPFDALRGYLYALPPVGTEAYCAQYNRSTEGRVVAPYVAGDPVVECSKSVPLGSTGAAGWVGARMGDGGYSPGALERLPRPQQAHSKENSHEIYLIRAAIITKLLSARQLMLPSARTATPWATFVTFSDMLDARPSSTVTGDPAAIITRDNLRQVLTNYNFADHFAAFLDMLKEAVADPDSYRGYHADETYRLAGERVQLALEMCGEIDSDDPRIVTDTVATQVAALLGFEIKKELVRKGWKVVKQAVADGDAVALRADELLGADFNTRIGLGLLLRAFQEKHTTRFDDYATQPELELCLNVALPDVSEWQKQRRAT